MKLGYVITIGTSIGNKPMSQNQVDDLIMEMKAALKVMHANQFSRPGSLTGELSQFGCWEDESTGAYITEDNLIWTGEIEEKHAGRLRRYLGSLASSYEQEAIALVLHPGAELIRPDLAWN